MEAAPQVEILRALDRARAAFNRVLLSSPLAPALIRKDRRIALQAFLGISSAFVLTLFAPLMLFAVAPLVLGVPHLAADLRYLVLRPAHTRLVRVLLLLGCLSFTVLHLLRLGGVRLTDVKLEMGCIAIVMLVVACFYARSLRRLAWMFVPLAVLGVVSYRHAHAARLVLMHAHNVIAIVVWVVLFRARGSWRSWVLPVGAVLVATAIVFKRGLIDGPSPISFGLSLPNIAGWLAPGLPLRIGIGLVLTFIFLQSLHYTIWLGLIPAEAVRGEATRSFRMTFRALVQDFGAIGLSLIAVASLVMVFLAVRDLQRTRELYLSLAGFHGYLEITILVMALAGRMPVPQ